MTTTTTTKKLEYANVCPRFNQILTTANVFDEDQKTESGVIDFSRRKGMYNTQQVVVAVGSAVRELQPGDLIEIVWGENRITYSEAWLMKNRSLAGLDPLSRWSHMDSTGITINYPVVEVDGVKHFLIFDNEVLLKFEPTEEK